MFLDCFDVLVLKIIFLNKIKNIILMYFQVKNTFKNNCYHILNHLLNRKEAYLKSSNKRIHNNVWLLS
jgi:hypothetical protein